MDTRLALIETERAAETGLPVAVIQSMRQRLNLMRAVPDTSTMRAWKSLRYEEAALDSNGMQSIAVSSQWTLHVRINDKVTPAEIMIMGLKEQIRGAA
ncbi:MAG: type II toxin-antitoxin system RelE/ParE family toxin [Bosea sp.]|uniref:type II toxin-antitoxin system RelE/ParE family toxin n=1 Tax=Bosea sp. (in: a-proteobacteria) TaxID=1871050 RepID=UPI001ACB52B6|nr:type II toxin-antitoxin system RelE/ParE family toxin [Bosea sp. (in: a-proteobacteria)]MBN9468269.1 type II toxin-antitoxin system RelE/ParE family toxin [Bosea sp. (in: a-proteobacteria)]